MALAKIQFPPSKETEVEIVSSPPIALVGSAFDPIQWYGATLLVSYLGPKVHSPCARYTQSNSNQTQRLWVRKIVNGQDAGILFDLRSPSPQWFASDVPQISPAVYRLSGSSFQPPKNEERSDLGMLISGTVYQNGLHLQVNWDDVSSYNRPPDFKKKITELFLPLVWQTDYKQVTPDGTKATITLAA